MMAQRHYSAFRRNFLAIQVPLPASTCRPRLRHSVQLRCSLIATTCWGHELPPRGTQTSFFPRKFFFSRSPDAAGGAGAGAAVRVMQERYAKHRRAAAEHQEREQQQRLRREGRGGADGLSVHDELLWESLWKDNITPWDLGRPAPVLVSELERQYPVEEEVANMDRRSGNQTMRILVPGCGAGYDLISLFVHFDRLVAAKTLKEATVVGLDLSPTSLTRAATVLKAFRESSSYPDSGSTRILLVHGNYFDPTSSWTTRFTYHGGEMSASVNITAPVHDSVTDSDAIPSQYDLLFDYTFFCALPPSAREQWGTRTSQLLHPSDDSRILTLMFPVLEDIDAPIAEADEDKRVQNLRGPPFPVLPRDYQRTLEPHSIFMESHPYASPDTDPTREGKELVCWWRRR